MIATCGEGRGWIHTIVQSGALSAVRTNDREVSADEETIEALEADAVSNAAPMADVFGSQCRHWPPDECLEQLDAPEAQQHPARLR